MIWSPRKRNGVIVHYSALKGYTKPQTTTWANVKNFGMKHAPGAGSITSPTTTSWDKIMLCYSESHDKSSTSTQCIEWCFRL